MIPVPTAFFAGEDRYAPDRKIRALVSWSWRGRKRGGARPRLAKFWIL